MTTGKTRQGHLTAEVLQRLKLEDETAKVREELRKLRSETPWSAESFLALRLSRQAITCACATERSSA
jgi:hypothetical protein